MLLNLSKDGCILSKDSCILSKVGFGVSHQLGHGSLCSSEGLGCKHKIADNGHDGKKILSNDVNRCHGSEEELGSARAIRAGDEE